MKKESKYGRKVLNDETNLRPQNMCTYNPYEATIKSISEMVEKYANGGDLQDFYDNVKVKCKEAKEYDTLFPQNHWKPADADDLSKEEPISNVWHDAQIDPPQAKKKILAINEYGSCEVDYAINMALYWPKVIKWAYVEDLLNISNVQRTGKNWNEPVSEDLEEAAKRYATEGDETSGLYIIDEEVEAFKAGAKWQKHLYDMCEGDKYFEVKE